MTAVHHTETKERVHQLHQEVSAVGGEAVDHSLHQIVDGVEQNVNQLEKIDAQEQQRQPVEVQVRPSFEDTMNLPEADDQQVNTGVLAIEKSEIAPVPVKEHNRPKIIENFIEYFERRWMGKWGFRSNRKIIPTLEEKLQKKGLRLIKNDTANSKPEKPAAQKPTLHPVSETTFPAAESQQVVLPVPDSQNTHYQQKAA